MSLNSEQVSAGKRTVVDFLAVVTNQYARHQLPGEVPLRPVAAGARLLDSFPPRDEVPAYRFAFVEGEFATPPTAGAGFFLEDIISLTSAMLM
jgi:hypothetical protein